MDKNEVFILKLNNIFGNKYDYSLVDYINNRIKVKLICPIHGIFEKSPKHLLTGSGCQKCSKEILNNKFRKNKNDFINELKKIFKDKYDYSLVDYINVNIKVKLICPTHGIFEKSPKHLLTGSGCQKCSKEISNKKQKKEKEILIKDFIKTHGDKYDYSLIDYKNTYTPIKIICKKHGIFKQIPRDHIRGYNCPKCNQSKGENIIKEYLDRKNIEYEQQKTFEGCNYKKPLKFDFYLKNHSLCIEYDGLQHYKPRKFFGGIKEFNKLKEKDKIKNIFCQNNNIKLIRVPYFEKDINKFLENEMKIIFKKIDEKE